jgi:hypothetical protein
MDEVKQVITSVSFDPDVLYATDTYIAEIAHQGQRTNRSALVNTALLYYLSHIREEAATQEAADAIH